MTAQINEEKELGVGRYVVIQEDRLDLFQKRIDEAVARGAEFFPESFQYVWIPRVSARVYLAIIRIPPDSV